MSNLRSIDVETPDGAFHIIIDERDIARASGFGDLRDLEKRLPEELRSIRIEVATDHPYERYVKDYYDGDPTALDTIPRDQTGSDFQKRVWGAISNIPYGKTVSYKQLAETLDNPAAVRSVGTICGLNRLILLIPCHRVLRSDGGIGGYLYGPKLKESLLRHEGALETPMQRTILD